ncbi:hypothetical protein JCM6882_005024 [Rhodosporidiobolus microsporus]
MSGPVLHPLPPLDASTPDHLRQLQEQRARAEATPLREGLVLPFVPLSSFSHAQASPNPQKQQNDAVGPALQQRPLDEELLDLLRSPPDDPECELEVRLVEPYATGSDRWSQVWLADVEVDGRPQAEVVVKFLVEALFPSTRAEEAGGESMKREWKTAEELLMAEIDSYAASRLLQGLDLPYLYGVALFRMPWGETVPGLFLEDLGHVDTLEDSASASKETEAVAEE